MRSLIALLFVVTLPWMAAAEDVLTWPEVQAHLRDHPETARASLGVQAAEGRLLAAHGWPNPEIEGELGRAWSYDGAEERAVWGVGVGTQLPFPAALVGRVKGARGARDEAVARQRQAWRETCGAARAMYLVLVRDQEAARLWEEAASQAEELQRLVQVRVDRGEDRGLEAFRAATDGARTRMQAERADVTWALHRDGLRRWLGVALPASFRVEGEGVTLAIPPAEEVRAAVHAAHPRLAAAVAELDAAAGALTEARGEIAPELHVGLGFEEELDGRALGGSVGLEIPLGSPGTGALASARAEKRMAELALESTRREIDLAVDEVWAGWSSADLAVRRYADDILPAARQTADALWVAYRVGDVSLLEALDARRVFLEVQLEALDAELERALAAEQVRALMGAYDAS